MAAKIKKGDKVVVITGRDKGRKGEVTQVLPKEGRALVSGVNTGEASPEADAEPGRRHHYQGSADPTVEHRDRRSQGWQARPASASRFSMTAARFVSPSVPEN